MSVISKRQILLASRPRGEPTLDNFKLVETEAPEPGPGQMLLRIIYLLCESGGSRGGHGRTRHLRSHQELLPA